MYHIPRRKRIRLTALFLAILMCLTSCQPKPPVNPVNPVDPGDQPGKKDEDTGKDGRDLSDEVIVLPDEYGHSEMITERPVEGMLIMAPADAFEKDTSFRVAPVTEADGMLKAAFEMLDYMGNMPLAAFEMDAGLEDDEIIPGFYTVTMSAEALGVDPAHGDCISVFRIGDNGSFYELPAEVENGNITVTCDQNSVLAYTIAAAVIGTAVYGIKRWENDLSKQYFYDSKKKQYSLKGSNPYGSYKIIWNMQDINYDYSEAEDRIREIAESYERRKDELYKKYKEEYLFDADNILNIFSRTKSVYEVLAEELEKDAEFKKLSKEMKEPEVIEFTKKCIDNAFEFLAKDQKLRMPTGEVEFIVEYSTEDEQVLATAQSRVYNEGFITLKLGPILNGSKKNRDNFLLTVTHELCHVCQPKYRAPGKWSESNRYDEMVAACMEQEAYYYYLKKDLLDEEAKSDFSPVDFWSTMNLPIDKAADTGKQDKDLITMRHQGYLLALFLRYLKENSGHYASYHTIMRSRGSILSKGYYAEPGVSGPLMAAFGISEAEFDMHYRMFIRKNKDRMSSTYTTDLNDNEYKMYEPQTLTERDKIHVVCTTEGSYTAGIRGFKQNEQSYALPLLVVPDPGLKDQQPELDLVPVGNFVTVGKVTYMEAEKGVRKSDPYRKILEVHGSLGKSNTAERNTGYTVYPLGKPKKPVLNETGNALTVQMPTLDGAIKDGYMDGYLLKIETSFGDKKNYELNKDFFEKLVNVDKSKLYGTHDMSQEMEVTVTLREFIKDGDKRYYGVESDPVKFTLSKADTVTGKTEIFVYPSGLTDHYTMEGGRITANLGANPENKWELVLEGQIMAGETLRFVRNSGSEGDYFTELCYCSAEGNSHYAIEGAESSSVVLEPVASLGRIQKNVKDKSNGKTANCIYITTGNILLSDENGNSDYTSMCITLYIVDSYTQPSIGSKISWTP